jgi:hypothetical protein
LTGAENDSVDEDLGALPPVLLVVNSQDVGDLVSEHPNLRVAGEPLVDDTLAALVVAPPLRRALDRELPDGVAELRGEALERGEEVRVRQPIIPASFTGGEQGCVTTGSTDPSSTGGYRRPGADSELDADDALYTVPEVAKKLRVTSGR